MTNVIRFAKQYYFCIRNIIVYVLEITILNFNKKRTFLCVINLCLLNLFIFFKFFLYIFYYKRISYYN